MNANPKSGVPSLGGQPDRVGSPFSRKAILDGDVRVAYGPGQRPNSTTIPHYPDDGSFVESTAYGAPTDWPKAGMPLRMPQVAWLSLYFPFRPSAAVGFIEGAKTYTSVPCGFDSRYTWADAYEEHATGHPIAAEVDRLRAAFADAKSRVEALRPGRTFVEVLDWLTADGTDRYQVGDNWFHLTCPPADMGFAGTDFLHLYCGHFGVDRLIADFIARPVDDVDVPLDGDAAHAASVARVLDVAAKFRGFAVRIYTFEGASAAGWSSPLPPYAFEFTPPPGVRAVADATYTAGMTTLADRGYMPGASGCDRYVSVFGTRAAIDGNPSAELNVTLYPPEIQNNFFWPPGYPRDTFSDHSSPFYGRYYLPMDLGASLAAYQTLRRNQAIDEANLLPLAEAQGSTATYVESLRILGDDRGVAISGDTTALDADALVALIASHFKFDAATGEDL